jgi:hypothetical protein
MHSKRHAGPIICGMEYMATRSIHSECWTEGSTILAFRSMKNLAGGITGVPGLRKTLYRVHFWVKPMDRIWWIGTGPGL